MKKRMTILLSILMLSTVCFSPVHADDMIGDTVEEGSDVFDEDMERDDYEGTMRLEGQTDYPEYGSTDDYYEDYSNDEIDDGGMIAFDSDDTSDYSDSDSDSYDSYDSTDYSSDDNLSSANSIDLGGDDSSSEEQTDNTNQASDSYDSYNSYDAQTPEQTPQTPQATETQSTSGTESNTKTDTGSSSSTSSKSTSVSEEKTMSFDNKFINFISKNYRTENYVISPLALKTSLCSLAYSANGETKNEILSLLDCLDEEEMMDWYSKVQQALKSFRKTAKKEKKKKGDKYIPRSFALLNTVWNNTSVSGNLYDEYKKAMDDDLKVHVDEADSEHITNTINKWYKKKTNGKLDKIATDFSQSDRTFISSLYLSSPWANAFKRSQSTKDLFVANDGTPTEKIFIQQKAEVPYFENDEGKMIILPLRGKMYVAMSIGDINALDYLNQAEEIETYIKIPKFETVTTLNPQIVADFINPYGVETAYTDQADFSKMSDQKFKFNNLLQKNKITVDESGINAEERPEKKSEEFVPSGKKNFIANEPMQYYVYYQPAEEPILIYYGQYVK